MNAYVFNLLYFTLNLIFFKLSIFYFLVKIKLNLSKKTNIMLVLVLKLEILEYVKISLHSNYLDKLGEGDNLLTKIQKWVFYGRHCIYQYMK